jgi:CelD/BcsL family acetyltransferase involved in cellulose biosynthesis
VAPTATGATSMTRGSAPPALPDAREDGDARNARGAGAGSAVLTGVVRPGGGLVRVERHDSVDAIADDWDALADRTGSVPWMRPGWIRAWWSAFGHGRLEVVTVWRAGRLAALAVVRHLLGEVLTPSDWYTPCSGLLGEDDEALAVLAEALLERRPRRLELRQVVRGHPGLAACRVAAADAGYHVLERTLQRAPYLDLGSFDGDFAAYEATRSRELVRNVRRGRRRLAELGRVSVEFHDGRERLAELLEEAFRVEASGWKGERRSAMASRERTRLFWTTVFGWAASRGWLHLAFLHLDGRAIAFQANVGTGDVRYGVKTGYDGAFGRASPGALLMYEELKEASRAGLRRFELLGPDQPYKMAWATGMHEISLLQAFAPGPMGTLERIAFERARPVVKRLLRSRHG